MQVISHQIDEVQVLAHARDIVGRVCRGLPNANRSRQQQRACRRLFQELFFEYSQHLDVIRKVLGRLRTAHIVVARHNRVFPVQVETIEAPLPTKSNDVSCKLTDLRLVGRDVAKDFAGRPSLPVSVRGGGGAIIEIPTPHTDESLYASVLFFHADSHGFVSSLDSAWGAGPVAADSVRVVPVWSEIWIIAGCRTQAVLALMAAGMVGIGIIALQVEIFGHRGKAIHEVSAEAAIEPHLKHIFSFIDQPGAVPRPVGEVTDIDPAISTGRKHLPLLNSVTLLEHGQAAPTAFGGQGKRAKLKPK
mmetsp:Transcript_47170/g.88221  ORF Transcript_47170/g.88221 Transcript_47170/m.88221 type:complete len:304 (-) Transcript_47170:65-976(-)